MQGVLVLLYAWLITLQLFNAWITRQILAEGAREPNPVMRGLMRYMGVAPALLLPKALAMAVLIYADPPAWGVGLLVLLYMGVCLHSLWQAR